MTNAQRGARAKARTKQWLEAQGYQVADLEVVRYVGPRRIPRKQDQFGADLLAMSDAALLFVQVKSGAAARTGRFPAARRAFAKFRFAPGTQRLVIGWPPRAREPRVVWM